MALELSQKRLEVAVLFKRVKLIAVDEPHPVVTTGTVFKGTASFALTFAVDIQEKADAVDTVSAVKGPVSE